MDCQPPQPQAGKALLKRSLGDLSNVDTSSAKPQQCSARLRSNAAAAAAQRRCNLDAQPDDLFRRILDTLSRKDVGAAAATCKRFATEWRHAAGASAVLFPQLSAESCTRLRQFVGDAYAGGDDLSTEAGAQNFLVKKLPGRVFSQFLGFSCFDLFCGALGSRWLDGLELKICNYNQSCRDWCPTLTFWGEDEALPEILIKYKDQWRGSSRIGSARS